MAMIKKIDNNKCQRRHGDIIMEEFYYMLRSLVIKGLACHPGYMGKHQGWSGARVSREEMWARDFFVVSVGRNG